MNKVASCGPNQVFSQGLCYPKCRDDWTGQGPTCAQDCPKTGQFLNLGPLCQKKPIQRGAGSVPQLQPCPVGYIDNGRDCIQQQVCQWPNQCQGSGLPTIEFKDRQQCPKDTMELSQGFCQKKCPKGYTGVAGDCWPNCPPGFTDTGPGTQGQNCVKPTQGRGLGLPPSKTNLALIAQSPNGSTLLERQRQGQTVAQTAANTNTNYMGSSTLGDPKNVKSNPSSFINSVWSSGSLISQTLGTKVTNSLGLSSPEVGTTFFAECSTANVSACFNDLLKIIFWIVVGVILIYVFGFVGSQFYQDLAISFTGTGTVIAGVAKGFGEAAGGVATGLGAATKGAEVGLGTAIQGVQTAATGIVSEGFRDIGQIGSSVVQSASQLAQTSANELAASAQNAVKDTIPAVNQTVGRVGYNIQGGWTSMLE